MPAFLFGNSKRRLMILVSIYAVFCVAGIMAISYGITNSFEFKRQHYLMLFLIELAFMLFLAPLLPVRNIVLEKQERAMLKLLLTRRGSLSVAIRIVAKPLIAVAILCLVPGLAALVVTILFGGVPIQDLIRASIMVVLPATGAAAIGSYCSVRCQNAFSSAGLALLVVTVVIFAPILLGPAMGPVRFLIPASMVTNPFVGLASTMNFDLFRTEPLYQICPIGQLRFEYPPWWSVALVYLSVSLLLFWRSVAGIRKMADPSM